MNKALALLIIVLIFSYLQFFVAIIPVWIVYLLIFTVPIIRMVTRKDYHLFSFDLTDTIQSVTLNSLFALGLVTVLTFIGLIIKRTSIVAFTSPDTIEAFFGLLMSLFQELFFRYYIQETLETLLENANKSIFLTSIISASFFIPKWEVIIVFFIMGLFFGWIYNKTKDIYGITIGHFIISLFLDFTI